MKRTCVCAAPHIFQTVHGLSVHGGSSSRRFEKNTIAFDPAAESQPFRLPTDAQTQRICAQSCVSLMFTVPCLMFASFPRFMFASFPYPSPNVLDSPCPAGCPTVLRHSIAMRTHTGRHPPNGSLTSTASTACSAPRQSWRFHRPVFRTPGMALSFRMQPPLPSFLYALLPNTAPIQDTVASVLTRAHPKIVHLVTLASSPPPLLRREFPASRSPATTSPPLPISVCVRMR